MARQHSERDNNCLKKSFIWNIHKKLNGIYRLRSFVIFLVFEWQHRAFMVINKQREGLYQKIVLPFHLYDNRVRPHPCNWGQKLINTYLMKRIIGIFLLILAVYLGYTGITKFSGSSSSVEVLGLELNAEDKQQKNTSYLYIGFAVIAAIGGIALIRSEGK